MKPLLLICFLLAPKFTLEAQRILFVGNSLFTDKHIPDRTREILQETTIKVDDVSKDGYRIKWHLKDTASLKKLENGDFDVFVVLAIDYKKGSSSIHKLDSIIGNKKATILLVQPFSSFYPKAFREMELNEIIPAFDALEKQFPNVQLIRLGEILDCYLDYFPDAALF